MLKKVILLLFFAHTLMHGNLSAQVVAFPGAEGFGKYTTGGRGGETCIVNNLNDSGPGSFREAVTKKTKRIVVFQVSGTIHLQTKLTILGDITIAGQTAPGEGICLADQTVGLGGDNIIVRYIRFRLGDKFQRGEMLNGNGGDDAFGGNRRKNIIIDHCSMSWSNDEVFSIYGGDSTTIQWNLIAEPLNYSYHYETGDKDFENHGYGGIWGGKHTTAHHNLFAHCVSRNPRFNGARLGAEDELVDFSNNVIYNWQHNSVYGGEGGKYNMVNNYYRPGPMTHSRVQERIVNPTKNEQRSFGKFFVNGNIVEGSKKVTQNNLLGVHMEASNQDKMNTITSQPFEVIAIPNENAAEAFLKVLDKVGASFKRDTLDQRIIEDVIKRRGKIIDVQGGFPHGTPFEQTLIAWPTLKMGTVLVDSDQDGIPDVWEMAQGLDPKNALDAQHFNLLKEYSNLEVYINSILVDAKFN
jgi:pectate lyase